MLCQVWSLVWVVREIHQSLSVHTLGCSAPNIEAACKRIHTSLNDCDELKTQARLA